MSNGQVMDAAQVKALASGDPQELNEWLITCTLETRKAVDQIPDLISDAICKQRSKDLRLVGAVAAAAATAASVISPWVLHML
jgi:hypothetical protein